jgi:hypothetical protein
MTFTDEGKPEETSDGFVCVEVLAEFPDGINRLMALNKWYHFLIIFLYSKPINLIQTNLKMLH